MDVLSYSLCGNFLDNVRSVSLKAKLHQLVPPDKPCTWDLSPGQTSQTNITHSSARFQKALRSVWELSAQRTSGVTRRGHKAHAFPKPLEPLLLDDSMLLKINEANQTHPPTGLLLEPYIRGQESGPDELVLTDSEADDLILTC
jgi:hypothetical protein